MALTQLSFSIKVFEFSLSLSLSLSMYATEFVSIIFKCPVEQVHFLRLSLFFFSFPFFLFFLPMYAIQFVAIICKCPIE